MGTLIALTFLLTLEDAHRFRKSRDVGCYLGLQAGRRNSDQSEPQMHISKEGDPYLRTLLVQGAHHILGPFGADSDLRRWGCYPFSAFKVSGGQSSGLLHPGASRAGSVFAVEHTPGLRLVRRRPGASLDEVGLRPYFAIDGAGRNDGHLNSAFGRNAAAGIHDVRVTASFGKE